MLKVRRQDVTTLVQPLVAISYYSRPETSLCYAERYGTRPWNRAVIDTEGGSFSSLALDSFGFPHIAYHVGIELATLDGDGAGSELRYCRFDGTSWQAPETVDNGGQFAAIANCGVELGLSLNGQDMPRIGYRAYDKNHGQLNAVMYAMRELNGWSRKYLAGEELGSNGDFNVGARAVTVHDQGTDRVIYSMDADGRALYSWFRGPEGDSTTVVARADLEGLNQGFLHWPSVAMVGGVPHVAFADGMPFGGSAEQNNLKHAWRNTQLWSWEVETIDGPHKVGNFCSLAADPNTGRLAISYLDRNTKTIRCARQSGQLWIIDDLDVVDTEVDAYTSCAVDRHGEIYVAYYSERTPGLMLARRTTSGGWSIEPVHAGTGIGVHCSVKAL